MQKKVFQEKLEVKPVGFTMVGQDGAIYNEYLFRFDSGGKCCVFALKDLEKISTFVLDKKEYIVPHSNAVCFGTEFYEPGDEFPLLYTNVYNNYMKQEDRRIGICCVYRILREGDIFSSQLVQLIQIDFAQDLIWRSEQVEDVRPYGNFVVDRDSHSLYAFVMRDEERATRFFEFALPGMKEGMEEQIPGVKVVHLQKKYIQKYFDCGYITFMQGAVCAEGYIYSVEGFSAEGERPPALRVYDLEAQKEVYTAMLGDYGLGKEAELIEVYKGKIYYSDNTGAVYELIL